MNIKKIILTLSIIFNILLIGYSWNFNNQIEGIPGQMGFEVQRNLVELDLAIKYQEEHDWEAPHHVVDKIDEIIKGIYITLDVSKKMNKLEDENEESLRNLAGFLKDFDKSTGYPNVKLTEGEKDSLVKLRDSLRYSGWGENTGGYSSSMDELIDKSNTLIKYYYDIEK